MGHRRQVLAGSISYAACAVALAVTFAIRLDQSSVRNGSADALALIAWLILPLLWAVAATHRRGASPREASTIAVWSVAFGALAATAVTWLVALFQAPQLYADQPGSGLATLATLHLILLPATGLVALALASTVAWGRKRWRARKPIAA